MLMSHWLCLIVLWSMPAPAAHMEPCWHRDGCFKLYSSSWFSLLHVWNHADITMTVSVGDSACCLHRTMLLPQLL